MTDKIRRTEIIVEKRELKIIRSRSKRETIYCQHCRTSVVAFTPKQVLAFLQMIESGKTHLIETANGVLVCGNSLNKTEK